VRRLVLGPTLPINDEMQQATSLPACDEIGPLVPAAGRSPSPWHPVSPSKRLVTDLAPSPLTGAHRRRSSVQRRRTRLPGRSSVLLCLSASSRILLLRLPPTPAPHRGRSPSSTQQGHLLCGTSSGQSPCNCQHHLFITVVSEPHPRPMGHRFETWEPKCFLLLIPR
jgi:hypothetical protein